MLVDPVARYKRVRRVALRACRHYGIDAEWADDVAQEWAAGVLAGAHGSEDYSGRAWYMAKIVSERVANIHARARPHTLYDLERYLTKYAWRPAPATAWHDLRSIWEAATPGERGAILSLITMPRGELPSGWRQPSATTAARKRRATLLATLRRKWRAANKMALEP